VDPAEPEENSADTGTSSSGDNEDMTVTLTSLFGDATPNQSAKAPAGNARVQPKNRQGAIELKRDTKRPGVLKRMLVSLGLARSRK
jgi:flagellar hook-length control protein FliK